MSSVDTLRATGALIAVLALVFLISWFFKRMMMKQSGSHSVARIVGGVSLGTRERLMVVEVGTQWIVVGVTPGRVTALASLEASSCNSADAHLPADAAVLNDVTTDPADRSIFKNLIKSALRK